MPLPPMRRPSWQRPLPAAQRQSRPRTHRLIGLLIALVLALTIGVTSSGPATAAPAPPANSEAKAKAQATADAQANATAKAQAKAVAAKAAKARAAAAARAQAARAKARAAAALAKAVRDSGPKARTAARAYALSRQRLAVVKARAAVAARTAAVARTRAVATAKAAATAKARAATVAKSSASKQAKTAAKASAKTAAKTAKAYAKAYAKAAAASVAAQRAVARARLDAAVKGNAATATRLAYVGYAKQRADYAARAAKVEAAKSAAASKAAKVTRARYLTAAKATAKARKKVIAASKKAAPYLNQVDKAEAAAEANKAALAAAKANAKAAAKELKAAAKAAKKAKGKSAAVKAAAAQRLQVAKARVATTKAAVNATAARASATNRAYAAAAASTKARLAGVEALTASYEAMSKATARLHAQSAQLAARAKVANAAARSYARAAAAAKKAAGPNASWAPHDYMTFNNPRGSKARRYAIIKDFNSAINSVPAGGEIRMAMYLFDIKSVADNLIAAHRRGVSVQIVIDGEESNKWIRKVKRALGKNKKARSFVATCAHSCMSKAQAVIHAKYYLFSVAGQRKYVSIISSANPYTGNTSLSWNNAHTIVGDKVIYDSLNRYFRDMVPDKSNRKYFRTTESGKYKIYLYPQTPKKASDIVWIDALDRVTCKTSKGYGTTNGQTMIRVANWGWSSARIDVAKKLLALQAKGCNVQVMINRGRITRPVLRVLLTKTKHGRIPIYDAWRDSNNDGFASLYVHHKMMTIDGRMDGRNVKITWTGSQNFTGPGTYTNTDLVLRIVDPRVTTAYENNFAYIRGKATKRVQRMPWAVGRTGLALE